MFDFFELSFIFIEMPKSENIVTYLISSSSSSLLTSQLRSYSLFSYELSSTFSFYQFFALLVKIIQAFSIKEIILLFLVFGYTIMKYLSFNNQSVNNANSILFALELIILILLVTNLSFLLLLLLNSNLIIDISTFIILNVIIYILSGIIVFITGCIAVYKPLKKRIYSPLG
jgi:hypothetical protein